MKLTIDLDKVEIKVLNMVEINDQNIKETIKEALKKWNSEEIITQFEETLALGVVEGLMKEFNGFNGKVRLKG